MRLSQALLAVPLLVAACNSPEVVRNIPAGQLYFPTGMVYAPGATQEAGTLYVASSDFDRRYARGRVTGIRVDSLYALGLPAFNTATAPVAFDSLGTISERWVAALAGDMASIPTGAGTRLVVPSRAETNAVQIIDAVDEQLTCVPEDALEDCSTGALTTDANRLTSSGKPRAPAPFGVAIAPDGDTFVSSLNPADSPSGSSKELEAFVVRFNAFSPEIANPNFISMGTAVPTNSVVVGQRYAYLTGRLGLALRLVDRLTQRFFTAQLENQINVLDTRGLALAPNEGTLYVAAKQPDVLLVVDLAGVASDAPRLTLERETPLPAGASQVKVIGRPGRGNVALVSCVGTQALNAAGAARGSLLVWDDDAARIVAEVDGIGSQPYGIAVQPIGAGARIWVGLFGEGRLAVLDMPDLTRPQELSLVAQVGTSHICLVNPTAPECQ